MTERKATPEQLASTQTPEYQEHLRNLVAEPGQAALAYTFFPHNYFPDLSSPLTPMERKILQIHMAPQSLDWENIPVLWEQGDEISSAYGVLTLRGLIVWKPQTGQTGTWLLSEITSLGKKTLEQL